MSRTPQHPSARYLLLALYYSSYLIGFTGWIFFRGYSQRKFHYSAIDIVYLALMALPLLFPPIVWFGRKRLPSFRNKSATVVGAFVVASWYLVFSAIYYNTQEHLFDPFVQMPLSQLSEQNAETSDRTFRILTLGGSTTQGFGLPKNKSYPDVLDALLHDRFPSKAIKVFNAGMQWYTSKHSLINFVTYYQDWNPDVTIVMHGVNDLFRSCVPIEFAVAPYNDEWSHFYGPAIRGAKPLTFATPVGRPVCLT